MTELYPGVTIQLLITVALCIFIVALILSLLSKLYFFKRKKEFYAESIDENILGFEKKLTARKEEDEQEEQSGFNFAFQDDSNQKLTKRKKR